VSDARSGARQTAYQIRVGASAGSAGVWDSGKVASDASVNVADAGPTLKSSQRYWWSVRTWGAHGSAGEWSAPASFGTAVKSDWQGRPIWTSVPSLGSDYTLDADFSVTTVAAGIKFRASGGNSFMWQIRGDSARPSPSRSPPRRRSPNLKGLTPLGFACLARETADGLGSRLGSREGGKPDDQARRVDARAGAG
jgi:hypothetical protein